MLIAMTATSYEPDLPRFDRLVYLLRPSRRFDHLQEIDPEQTDWNSTQLEHFHRFRRFPFHGSVDAGLLITGVSCPCVLLTSSHNAANTGVIRADAASPLLHDCTNSAIVCESSTLIIKVNITEKTLMDMCVQIYKNLRRKDS